MGCDGITWDVPQSPIPYALIPGVHPVPVYYGMGWDTELCGTSQAVLSCPMVHWNGIEV